MGQVYVIVGSVSSQGVIFPGQGTNITQYGVAGIVGNGGVT